MLGSSRERALYFSSAFYMPSKLASHGFNLHDRGAGAFKGHWKNGRALKGSYCFEDGLELQVCVLPVREEFG